MRADTIVQSRTRRLRRNRRVITILSLVILVFAILGIHVGSTFLHPIDVFQALLGDTVPGVRFTLMELRLPRVVMGLLAGFAFGIAGLTFQSLLRNPLASPDIIGITSGASAAAVFGIVLLGWGEVDVSLLAVGAAIATAAAILAFSAGIGFATVRLILIGIGIAAMLDAIVAYLLSRASAWDVQTAMRWLAGSLNGVSWQAIAPLTATVGVFATILLSRTRALGTLVLGEDIARGLGLPVRSTRLLLLLAAAAILAFATAASGPIAFVAFMAGPIAVRLVGSGDPPLLAAGLCGSALVLTADFVGQQFLGTRVPVGVVTGVLGAPFLIYLLVKNYRIGGTL